MREKDIHNLIEQQNPEAKQRLWEKISSQLNLAPQPEAQAKAETKPKLKIGHWAAIAAALVCIITLSVVLPIALKDDGVRYCDATQYTTEDLGQTLREYSLSHNNMYLYVDWYDMAEEITTEYGHINDNKNDVIFLEEYILNSETGVTVVISVTNNKTKVDKFEPFNDGNEAFIVKDVTVQWHDQNKSKTFATFEHKGYIYYLRLDIGEAKTELTEIIEGMLK